MKEKNKKINRFFLINLIAQYKVHKKTFIVYWVLRILVVISLVRSIISQNYENVGLCILTLVLFLLPAFVQKRLRIKLPTALEIIVLLFIFASEILGEINCFFVKVPGWDTMLHTTNGFLCAAIGFSLVDLLNRDKKINVKLSPGFIAIVAFCFSMTIGVLWEFFEFGCDAFLHTDMQKDTIVHVIRSVMLDPSHNNIPVSISNINNVIVNGNDLGLGGYLDIGLIDTMKDLFVNFLGAVIFSIMGFFHLRNLEEDNVSNKKNELGEKIVNQLIPTVDSLSDESDNIKPKKENKNQTK